MEKRYSDEQIIAMIESGGEQRDLAFKYFFTDPILRQTVVQKILIKGGAENDAEDAFQEGFKVFYRHLVGNTFQGRSTLRTYFVGICLRCWLDGLKKSFYQRTELTGEEPVLDREYEDTPEVNLLKQERKSKLREVLDLLGERCRKIIMLKYHGFKDKEIKKRLQLQKDVVVRKMRHRCMTRLHENLKDNPHLSELLKTLMYG